MATSERVIQLRDELVRIDSITETPAHGLTEAQLMAWDREYEATVAQVARTRTKTLEGLAVIADLYVQEMKQTGDVGSQAHALALGFMRNVLGGNAV